MIKMKRTFDVRDGPNVIFGRQNKLIVNDPFGFVVEARGRMQLDHLVVLDS